MVSIECFKTKRQIISYVVNPNRRSAPIKTGEKRGKIRAIKTRVVSSCLIGRETSANLRSQSQRVVKQETKTNASFF